MTSSLPPLDVTFRLRREEVTVGLGGEIDIATEPDLSCLFEAAVGQSRDRVVLDLGDVEFMGVAGINQIAALAGALQSAGRQLVIRSAAPLVRRMLGLTGLDDLVRADGTELHLVHGGATGSAVPTGPRARPVPWPGREDAIDAALGLAVSWAAAVIGGADGVSVTLQRRGRLVTTASSDPTAARLDAVQYGLEQGPCVHAVVTGRSALLSPAAGTTRWPDFLPQAREAGIAAVLSTPLAAASGPVGALNLYSRSGDAFGPEEEQLAGVIAAQAAGILGGDQGDLASVEQIRRLDDALRAREVTARAQGILMHRDRISAEEATAQLRRSARHAGMPVRQLAAELVDKTGDVPDPSDHG